VKKGEIKTLPPLIIENRIEKVKINPFRKRG
jgi:hypothetical protein